MVHEFNEITPGNFLPFILRDLFRDRVNHMRVYSPFSFSLHNIPKLARGLYYRGFTITPRHTTVDRTPLDEWSARLSDLFLTTRNIHKSHTSMSSAGCQSSILASQRPHTHALDCEATGIGCVQHCFLTLRLLMSYIYIYIYIYIWH